MSDSAPLKPSPQITAHATPPPFATVTICTYNRARWLRETLAFITRQDYPADHWEIIVVDNNSADDTRAVVAEFSTAPKPPRYVLEKNQGSSHARNRGIAEAAGEIIVFTDDDMLGPTDWLRRLMAPFQRPDAAAIAAVGGEVIPVFPEGLPQWIEGYWKPLALRPDLGPLDERKLPMTANLAIRKEVFAKIGTFRPDLGRIGTHSLFNEDHELCRRLFAAGYAMWYNPDAALQHQIPASRLSFKYTYKQASHAARSRVVESGAKHGPAWLLLRVFSYTLNTLWCGLLALLCLITLQAGRAKRFLLRAGRCWGYVSECTKSLLRGKPQPAA